MNIENVAIRPFISYDYRAVIEIITESFISKLGNKLSITNQEVSQMLGDLKLIDRISFNGYYVAEYEEQVVGVMMLKWSDQTRQDYMKAIDYKKIFKQYGILKPLRMIISLSLLEEKVTDSECYIEHIAVHKAFRGNGIGSKLLEKAHEIASKLPKAKVLSLNVAATNYRAIDLYQIRGFRPKACETSFLTNIFMQEKEWYYMTKKI